MQLRSKRRYSRLGIFVMVLGGVFGCAVGLLLMRDIPAPSKPVVKELDAKAFLD